MAHSKSEVLKMMAINPWFAALPMAERKAMLAVATWMPVTAGELVFRKGDEGNGFFGVLDGVLRVSITAEDGREGILSLLEAGQWFGELSLLDGEPRPHDVTVLRDGVLLVIAPRDFWRLMGRIGFAQGMTTLLSARVRGVAGLVEDAMLRSTRMRVARRLISLARGGLSGATVARSSVQVSHEELAMMQGVTRQTLAKELKYLVNAGVLSLGYGHIDLLDMDLLLREAALT